MGKKLKQTIEDRAKGFAEKLKPYLDSEGGKYTREMLNEFWRYWTEHNEGGLKMRYEMQKVFNIQRRLITWHLNQQKYERISPRQSTAKDTSAESALRAVIEINQSDSSAFTGKATSPDLGDSQ